MKENRIAKILQIIGIIEVVCGILAGLVILANGSNFGWVGVVLMMASFITCMFFQGFAEIIDLLYKNGKKQDAILSYIKEKPIEGKTAPKTVLQDIESNLPQM